MTTYKTVFEESQFSFEEKRSTFLSFAAPCSSEKEVSAFFQRHFEEHPRATHHCKAWVLGEQGLFQRFDDDGEPSGTAGMPMLNVLKQEKLTQLAVVSIRYFGGIKLGASGLVRAYTNSAHGAIEAARQCMVQPYCAIRVQCSYEIWGRLEYRLQQRGIHYDQVAYAQQVQFCVFIEEVNYSAFCEELLNWTAGKAQYHLLHRCKAWIDEEGTILKITV